jgi:DNA-directed RNA polymerase subunit RPC12/RpoP
VADILKRLLHRLDTRRCFLLADLLGRLLRFLWYRGWLSFARCSDCGKKVYLNEKRGMKWSDGDGRTHYSCPDCTPDFSELEEL